MMSLREKADRIAVLNKKLREMASDIYNPELFKDFDHIIFDMSMLEYKIRREVSETIESIINELS